MIATSEVGTATNNASRPDVVGSKTVMGPGCGGKRDVQSRNENALSTPLDARRGFGPVAPGLLRQSKRAKK